jgi:hypothetical protein
MLEGGEGDNRASAFRQRELTAVRAGTARLTVVRAKNRPEVPIKRLHQPAAMQFGDDRMHDLAHLAGIKTVGSFAGRASADGLIREAVFSQ